MLLTTSYLESINLRKRIKATRNKTTATVVAGRMVLLSLLSKKIKKLYGQVWQGKRKFLPYETNEFFTKEIDVKIIFNFDKSGKVISLTKVQRDEMNAKKIE